MNVLDLIQKEQEKPTVPVFRPGDTVKVYSKVVEGGKERVQMFEGVVTVRKGGGLGETITVRRIAHGVGAVRLTASGNAEQHPFDSNATATGRARNRRVEIVMRRLHGSEGETESQT